MTTEEKHLEDLKEIRAIMERSSRFISLSGLSGVFAGIFAIAGALAVWFYIQHDPYVVQVFNSDLFGFLDNITGSETKRNFLLFLLADASLVVFLAVSTGIYLTTRQARKKGQSIWDSSSRRMIINLSIPLATGGIFCILLLFHGLIGLIAPSMLIFYGLALINGSKYTLTDIRYLGICELVLGLIAMLFIGYGIIFWTIGFGVLHILYGTVMHFKYDK